MNTVFLATASIAGFSAVVYRDGGWHAASRGFAIVAVAATAGYVATGGFWS